MFLYSIAQLPYFPKKNFYFLLSFYSTGKMTGLKLNYSFDILSKNNKNLLTNTYFGV